MSSGEGVIGFGCSASGKAGVVAALGGPSDTSLSLESTSDEAVSKLGVSRPASLRGETSHGAGPAAGPANKTQTSPVFSASVRARAIASLGGSRTYKAVQYRTR